MKYEKTRIFLIVFDILLVIYLLTIEWVDLLNLFLITILGFIGLALLLSFIVTSSDNSWKFDTPENIPLDPNSDFYKKET